MKCIVCGRGMPEGVTLYRQNPKGEKGIWACPEHNTGPIEPEVEEIVKIIEGARPGDGR